jgi:hypothetical protein
VGVETKAGLEWCPDNGEGTRGGHPSKPKSSEEEEEDEEEEGEAIPPPHSPLLKALPSLMISSIGKHGSQWIHADQNRPE